MKNKIFNFVLDLFKNGDEEEPASIFAQVKIYRSTSARVFKFIVGILVLAIWQEPSETSFIPHLMIGFCILS